MTTKQNSLIFKNLARGKTGTNENRIDFSNIGVKSLCDKFSKQIKRNIKLYH